MAETSEVARHAASLVRVEYEQEPHVTDIYRARDAAVPVKAPTSPMEAAFAPPKPRGEPDGALAAAAVRHEAEYFTPIEHHNPMELYASTVVFEPGGRLTVYDKTQGVQNVQRYLCGVFGMKPEDVRVMSPYMGGGFGSGLRPQFQVVLAVLAARALQRSVRVVLTRAQMYVIGLPAGDDPEDRARRQCRRHARRHHPRRGDHHLAIRGLPPAGDRLVRRALQGAECEIRAPARPARSRDLVRHARAERHHRAVCARIRDGRACGQAQCSTRSSFACGAIRTATRTRTSRSGSKALRECYREGAAAFGWDKRSPQPRSMRDGSDLIGFGMATGIWEALQVPITVRIALTANGHAEVACATSDIGTGTYTIMAQVAADMLGLPLENISIKLGDSSLPQSPVEGGSWIATSVSNGIVTTAGAIRDELLRMAKQMPNSPLANAAPDEVVLADGKLASKGDASRGVSIADAMRQGAVDRIEQEKTTNPSGDHSRANNTHAAHFVEVRVDEQLGVVRVTRAVSAVAAGRILNTKTGGSQILGSVVWGIGMALHEETHVDHRIGRIMNANLAEYAMPVHADIHDIKVIFVDEPDDSNPLGLKGLGEIGIVGVAAAVANAVYHATGKRVRDLPITLDKLQG